MCLKERKKHIDKLWRYVGNSMLCSACNRNLISGIVNKMIYINMDDTKGKVFVKAPRRRRNIEVNN